MSNKDISMAVIRRLPKYHRYLREMLETGVMRTSSKELSNILGFSSSQIRQDFNNFGEFGQQGYGYKVEDLYNEIKKIIGLTKRYNMIIIGAGNLGSALANYGFYDIGFNVKAIFDNSKEKIGKEINGIKVNDTNVLETYLINNDIDIVILSVPSKAAQNIADRLMISGIKSIWNFSSVDIVVPDDMVIENVHLIDSLMTLTYLINK